MLRRILVSLLMLVLAVVNASAQSKIDSTSYYRPSFHYTTNNNAMGKPIAALHADGVYHLFYQYNAVSNAQVFNFIGHAQSTDMLAWKENGVAVESSLDVWHPDSTGIGLGSALVDEGNILGRNTAENKAYLMFYAVGNRGVSLVFSTDKGKTWERHAEEFIFRFEENEQMCDPNIFWYAEENKFIMMLARQSDETAGSQGVSFYESNNLTNWKFNGHIRGLVGRPQLSKLKSNEELEEPKWVLSDASGRYMLGNFKGDSFSTLTSILKQQEGTFNYPVNFTDESGRVLQIASLSKTTTENLNFSGVMSIPMELSLASTSGGSRLIKKPIRELKAQKAKLELSAKNKKIIPGVGHNPLKKLKGDIVRIKGDLNLNNINTLSLLALTTKKNAGYELVYDPRKNSLECLMGGITYEVQNNNMTIELIIDKLTYEIFIDDGALVFSGQIMPDIHADEYELGAKGGELIINKLVAHSMKQRVRK